MNKIFKNLIRIRICGLCAPILIASVFLSCKSAPEDPRLLTVSVVESRS